MDSFLLEVVQSVDHFNLRPPQTIQLGDHQQVTFPKDRHASTELVSLLKGRGAAKTKLGDHQGAIAEWTKVIELIPKSGLSGLSYRNRGVDKAWIEDHEGACVDWKEAASLGDEDAAGWVKEFC